MPAERIALDALLDPRDGAALMTRIVSSLASAGVLVYPTETIYGIGGLATSDEARRTILRAKRRDAGNPMILIAGRPDAFDKLAITLPPAARRLARRFWPGPLTLVVTAAGYPGGIGIRVSPHPFLARLSAAVAEPLFSTSANVSGEAYVNDPEVIYRAFRAHVDIMVDAGVLPQSLPSTVVRVNDNGTIAVLRDGAVAAGEIEKTVIGDR